MGLLASCHAAPTQAVKADSGETVKLDKAQVAPAQMRLKALVYKTSVPCAQNVAISLNSAGTAVQSFPAPTDVSAASEPLQLPDGWLLDRRGLGPNTAFIRLTYAEYAKLAQAPSTAELMGMILPDAHVTEMRSLPMTPQEAAADTAAVLRLLGL